MDYEFIDKYNELRDTIQEMTKVDPSIMGDDAWLKDAIQTSDMTLMHHQDFVVVFGNAYTMQTSSHEWFEFMVSKANIELFKLEKMLEDPL